MIEKSHRPNPQKAQLLWASPSWFGSRYTDGVQLSGMLIKPENFDPQK
jgi:dipeptidyl aminopeptidase/acylaminoacyl peptidase